MKNIPLSKKEIDNLEEIFKENYLIIKKVKDLESNTYEENVRVILKTIKDSHEKNLLTIMKLLDEKERFIWWIQKII